MTIVNKSAETPKRRSAQNAVLRKYVDIFFASDLIIDKYKTMQYEGMKANVTKCIGKRTPVNAEKAKIWHLSSNVRSPKSKNVKMAGNNKA